MIGKTKVVAVAAVAVLATGAGAVSASAKGVVDIKEDGASSIVKAGTTVPAGWYIALGEKYACQLLPQEEGEVFAEEKMDLSVNASAKDKATGSVEVPPCFEVEEKAETGIAFGPFAARHRSRAVPKRHGFGPRATVITSSGKLSTQEIDSTKKGDIVLSSKLVISIEVSGKKCAYESKTKLAATWPPEPNPEFPNIGKTGNLDAGVTFKLDKTASAKTGCAKTEEGFVETWLGPLGKEFEASVVA